MKTFKEYINESTKFKKGDIVRYINGVDTEGKKDDREFTIDEIIKDGGRTLYNFAIGDRKFGHRAPEKNLELVK